jgi:hypothetical protein
VLSREAIDLSDFVDVILHRSIDETHRSIARALSTIDFSRRTTE